MAQLAEPTNLDVDYWRHRLDSHQWSPQEMEAYRAGRLAGRLEKAIAVAEREEARSQVIICCMRCQDYTDSELQGLRRESKVVGGLTISPTGEISPASWMNWVTPTERRLAVVLLRAYPSYAVYSRLMAVGGWEEHWDDRYHSLRAPLHRLRPKLQAVGLSLVTASGYGYRLEEIDDA